VALSADWNMALVGSYGENSGEGAAWVSTRSGGVWSQQGSKLVGTDPSGSAEQGESGALSGDGNTALIVGPDANGLCGGPRGSSPARVRAGARTDQSSSAPAWSAALATGRGPAWRCPGCFWPVGLV
jgi:hypothetical protein